MIRRGEGGFGLVSTCAAFVSEEGKAWPGQLGIATEAHEAALRPLARALRESGATSIVQLYHGGDKATLAPGDKLSTADRDGVRGATQADIDRVLDTFVVAAQRAERAGFDGVEIHGANGYLFTQFLAPEDNPRTDEYGGALDGRARFLRQAMRAVRAATADGFAVGVRISPVDVWAQRGLVLDDGVQVSCWLAEDGADFIHLSLSEAWAPPPYDDKREPVARAIRDAVPANVPIISAGGIGTRGQADEAIKAGVDIIALGRAGITHPDWPTASLGDEWEPIPAPWPVAALERAEVSPAFVDYLKRFPGLVEGGKGPRA